MGGSRSVHHPKREWKTPSAARTPPSDVPARAAGRKQPTPCSLKPAVLFRRIILNLVLCYIKWILLMMLKSLVYLVAYRKDAL